MVVALDFAVDHWVAQSEGLGPESWHTRPETGVPDQRLAAFARTPVDDTENPKQQLVPSVAEHTLCWNFAFDHCRSCWKLAQRRAPMRWDVAQSEALRPEAGVLDQWVAVIPSVRLVIPNCVVDHMAPSLPMLSLICWLTQRRARLGLDVT